MPTFNPASDQPEYELFEPGAYIATCIRIEDAPDKGFGPGVKWVFTLADPQSGVIFHDADGKEAELWQWTSVKMSPKARARPIVEALLGRPLDVTGREQPDVRQLIGKSMSTLIIWEKRDDGSDTARVTSCKPYVPASTPAVGAPPHRTAPPPATEDVLKAAVKAAIRKSEILGTPKHLDWAMYEPDRMSQSDLEQLLAAVQHDVLAV